MATHSQQSQTDVDRREVAFVFSYNYTASPVDAFEDCADALDALSGLLASARQLGDQETRGLNCILSGIAATVRAANEALDRKREPGGQP